MLVPSLSQHLLIQGLIRGEPLPAAWAVARRGELPRARGRARLAGRAALSTRGDPRLIIPEPRLASRTVEAIMKRRFHSLALTLLLAAAAGGRADHHRADEGRGQRVGPGARAARPHGLGMDRDLPGTGVLRDAARLRAQRRHRHDVDPRRVQAPAEPARAQERTQQGRLGLREAPALDQRRVLLQVEQPADRPRHARAVHQPAPLVGEDREGHGRRGAVRLRLQHPERDAGPPGPEPPKN